MNRESMQHLPQSNNAPEREAADLRKEPVPHTEEAIYQQLTKGVHMSAKAPMPLNLSGRILVATFLLPYEATIDIDNGRDWVLQSNVLHLT